MSTTGLRFGIFLPPMHLTGQNPTLTMHRDIELIRQRECFEQAISNGLDDVSVHDAIEQHDEFITAQSCDGVAGHVARTAFGRAEIAA